MNRYKQVHPNKTINWIATLFLRFVLFLMTKQGLITVFGTVFVLLLAAHGSRDPNY